MEFERLYSSDVAFSDTAKTIQTRKGSRSGYERMEQSGAWETRISASLATFISAQRSAFLATANKDGQPYVQHRGGPPGFIQVLDDTRLAFADFLGNRQYITQGNLVDNPKAQLLLIDYASRRRVKIWGSARVVEGDSTLTAQLMPTDYKARSDQVIIFDVSAWDANCPQHIPRRFEAADVAAIVRERDERIQTLEAEIERLLRRTGGC